MLKDGLSGNLTLKYSIGHRMLIRECPLDQHLGEGREGSRSGQREKLSCDAA